MQQRLFHWKQHNKENGTTSLYTRKKKKCPTRIETQWQNKDFFGHYKLEGIHDQRAVL